MILVRWELLCNQYVGGDMVFIMGFNRAKVVRVLINCPVYYNIDSYRVDNKYGIFSGNAFAYTYKLRKLKMYIL